MASSQDLANDATGVCREAREQWIPNVGIYLWGNVSVLRSHTYLNPFLVSPRRSLNLAVTEVIGDYTEGEGVKILVTTSVPRPLWKATHPS